MKPREVLRYWHGMTEAEVWRYKRMLDAGHKLNAIEAAEAMALVERVKAEEAAGWRWTDALPWAHEVEAP